MSGKRGVADTSRGPLIRPDREEDPNLEIQFMLQLREVRKMSYQAIADLVYPDVPRGAAYRRVYKALNREQVREWDSASEKRHRAEHTAKQLAYRRTQSDPCERCGKPLSRPGAKSPCRKCQIEVYDQNLKYLTKAWNAGVPSRQIAALLGVNQKSIASMVSAARRRGYDVVRRRTRPE